MESSIQPRVLLVEDDPTSRAFLAAAIETLPALVDAADSIASALDFAAVHTHALWLIDANLPDGHGADLLARLREHDATTPALAHTACTDRDALDALIAAGFAEVLIKPLAASELQARLRRALGRCSAKDPATPAPACDKLPLWDEEAALTALNGQRAHVDALRALFLEELPRSRDAIRAAAGRDDPDSIRASLHRLRASCGFVGATRLGAAVRAFEREPRSTTALQGFEDAARDLLASA